MTDAELTAERIRVEALPLDDTERAARLRGLDLLASVPFEQRVSIFKRAAGPFDTVDAMLAELERR